MGDDRFSYPLNLESDVENDPQPLVSVSIPTFNSARTLALCLDALIHQTYGNVEVNVIDGNSSDETVGIAERYGFHVVQYSGALLGARNEGTQLARGKYILLLDSDQVLTTDAIQRAVQICEHRRLSMLVLEESVYGRETLIEKLFELDRQLIHTVVDLSPYTGAMLPRFYRADLLRRAFASIPEECLQSVGGQDHAIIYYEAWLIDKDVDMLTCAVKHIEPDSLVLMWHKFYRWGRTSRAARLGKYAELLKKKERFRIGSFRRGNFVSGLASFALLLIKGVPYKVGVLASRVERGRASSMRQ